MGLGIEKDRLVFTVGFRDHQKDGLASFDLEDSDRSLRPGVGAEGCVCVCVVCYIQNRQKRKQEGRPALGGPQQ